VLGDLRERVCKPGLPINAVDFECVDQREHDRGGDSPSNSTQLTRMVTALRLIFVPKQPSSETKGNVQ
jgi:hypothetical protein